MNRQERRKLDRQAGKKHYNEMTKEQVLARMLQRGITPEDLRSEFDRGFKAGFAEATPASCKTVYAATLLVLGEEGRTQDECMRFLRRVDHHVIETLTSYEIIDEALAKTGIRLQFDDPTEETVEVIDGDQH